MTKGSRVASYELRAILISDFGMKRSRVDECYGLRVAGYGIQTHEFQ